MSHGQGHPKGPKNSHGKVPTAGSAPAPSSQSSQAPSASQDPVLAVKGAPAAPGLPPGSLRSPIAAAAASAPSQSSSEPAGNSFAPEVSAEHKHFGAPATSTSSKANLGPSSQSEGKRARRPVSKISGLDVSRLLSSNPSQPFSHVMYEIEQGRRRRRLLYFAASILAVGLVLALLYPRQRDGLIQYAAKELPTVLGIERSNQREPTINPRASGVYIGKAMPQAVREAAAVVPLPHGNCRRAIKIAAGAAAISVRDRVMLAECFLLVDNPLGAYEVLTPLMQTLVKTPESTLNKLSSHLTLADALHTATYALLRQGKVREADDLLSGRCRQWAHTNTCVAKAMISAGRSHAGVSNMRSMFGSQGRLDSKAQARLWLAGALIASAEGNVSAADRRYDLAVAAVPRQAMSLRKQIYEGQVLDLYYRGDTRRLRSAVGAAIAGLDKTESFAKTKLHMLGALANTRNRPATVRQLLQREDVRARARGDIDYLDVLGPESLRYGLESEFIKLVKQTSEQYNKRYQANDPTRKRLFAWEIRAGLSKRDYDAALIELGRYEGQFGRDLFAKHMRGVLLMHQSSNPRYQLRAAQEFQAALRLQMNWESLCALGTALIRANKLDQVPAVIRDLERMVKQRDQRYWVDMLKAEWYIAKGMHPNAQQILTKWLTSEPRYVTPRRLRLQLYTKLGKRTEAERESNALDELARHQRIKGSRESFASPAGVLALGRRPIE